MIKQPTIHRRTSVATVVGILSVLYASTFLVGALLHLGWRIPLGFTVLAEPKILPATVVEALCGLALAAAAIAVFASMRWAQTAALAAHSFSFGGVLLGMGALAIGAGPSTRLDTIYHRVVLVRSWRYCFHPLGRPHSVVQGDRYYYNRTEYMDLFKGIEISCIRASTARMGVDDGSRAAG